MPFYGDSYGQIAGQVANYGKTQADIIMQAQAAADARARAAAQVQQQQWQDAFTAAQQQAAQAQQNRQFDFTALQANRTAALQQAEQDRLNQELGIRQQAENRLGDEAQWRTSTPTEAQLRVKATLFDQALKTARSGTTLPDETLALFSPDEQALLKAESNASATQLGQQYESERSMADTLNASKAMNDAIQSAQKQVAANSRWYWPSPAITDYTTQATIDMADKLAAPAAAIRARKDITDILNFDPATGRYVPTTPSRFQTSPAPVPSAVQAPPAAAAPPQVVTIIGPKGKQFTIPISQLGIALKNGARLAPTEDLPSPLSMF